MSTSTASSTTTEPPDHARRLRRRVVELVREHPRTGLALKTAFAAALAWQLVQPLGGFVDEYPYYAPLGAVAVMGTTVLGSFRGSLQSVGAIVIGASLALVVSSLPGPGVFALAAAMAAGTLLAGMRWLGTMGSWVPFAALFVLVLGRQDPWTYVAAYAGLTAVGAAVGTVVNLVLPQLPLTPTSRAEARLRHEIVRRFETLAGQVSGQEATDQWASITTDLSMRSQELERYVVEVQEARRGNWRAGWWTGSADRSQRQGRSLQSIAGVASEITSLVSEHHGEDTPADDEFHRLLAATLRSFAHLLRETGEPITGHLADDEEAMAASRDLAALRSTVLEDREAGGDTLLARASIVTALERALKAWS